MGITKSEKLIKANSGLPNDYIENLRLKMRITKGSKYRASKRLRRHVHYSNLSLGFVAAYLVIINILFAFDCFKDLSETDRNVLTLSLSILILVYGQFLMFSDFKIRSYKFKQKALEIDTIIDKLLYSGKHYSTNPSELVNRINQLSKQYSSCLKTDEEDHLQIDYKKFLMDEGIKPINLDECKYNWYEKAMVNFLFYHIGFVQYYVVIYIAPLLILIWFLVAHG